MIVDRSHSVDTRRGPVDCGSLSIGEVDALRFVVSLWAVARFSSKPLASHDGAGFFEFSVGDVSVTHGV